MSAINKSPQVGEIVAELFALDMRMNALDWSSDTRQERETIENREDELFRNLKAMVPDEKELTALAALTYSDPEARAEYEHLYIKYPAREGEGHVAHLRRVLGVEVTEEFQEGLQRMISGGRERE